MRFKIAWKKETKIVTKEKKMAEKGVKL